MERRLAAIFVADMVGYSRRVHEAEEAALLLLREHRAIIDKLIESHNGRIFDSAGDSVLAEFSSPVEAVRSAVDIQRAIADNNASLPDPKRVKFRIGLHLGDVVVEGAKLKGEGINIASRLEAMAEPGGILISGDMHRQVHRTQDIGFDYLGERRLKNIDEPVRIYRVLPAPLPWWRKQLAGPLLRRRVPIAAAVLAGIAVFAANSPAVQWLPDSWRQSLGLEDAGRGVQQASIAIMPLRNISNDASQDYFSDGLTQDITGELAQFKNLFVVASNSAFTYKGKTAKAQDIGRDLGVVYLLEGTVMRDQGRVRLTAQLVNAKTGQQIWGQRFDQQGKDIFAIQDNIIKAVATNLAVQMQTATGYKPSASDATLNAEAYDHFLRGRQLFLTYEKDSVAQSKQEFQAAIALDPNYARARSYFGYALMHEYNEGWTDNPQQTADEALASALKAVELEPNDYYTYWTLGSVRAQRSEQDKALEAYQKALELNPNDADMLAEMADVFSNQSQGAKAVEQIKRAMELNPKFPDWYYWSLGYAYFQNRQYAEAAASIDKIADKPNEAYLIWVAAQNRMGKTVPQADVLATLKVKDAGWTPKALVSMMTFAKDEDKVHWLESFKQSGLDPAKP
jgi:adenylate cyclase